MACVVVTSEGRVLTDAARDRNSTCTRMMPVAELGPRPYEGSQPEVHGGAKQSAHVLIGPARGRNTSRATAKEARSSGPHRPCEGS